MEARFKNAVAFLQKSKDLKFDNNQKLQFYALFKQATTGACTEKAPSKLKVVERAKYDAWKSLGSITKEQAMERYIKILETNAP